LAETGLVTSRLNEKVDAGRKTDDPPYHQLYGIRPGELKMANHLKDFGFIMWISFSSH